MTIIFLTNAFPLLLSSRVPLITSFEHFTMANIPEIGNQNIIHFLDDFFYLQGDQMTLYINILYTFSTYARFDVHIADESL